MAGISKRVSGAWVSGDERVMKTATDIIVPPTTIYADGTNATVGLVGNMSQTGTPTPSAPIYPTECGDLVESGEHAGQYKIPISSASTTTPVYLGEVETTRKIKKYEITGQENWELHSTQANLFRLLNFDGYLFELKNILVCNTYKSVVNGGAADFGDKQTGFYFSSGAVDRILYIRDSSYSTASDFKTYLQQQYAAGTPVTIWYVLAAETTGIVNEPLRKIGDYADEVSGISIPTIAGADTLSVDTTLQPSEVSATYKGWHEGTVHERDSEAWD